MKQYVVDELRLQDYEKIKAYCDAHFGAAEIGGIYWVPLDTMLLTPLQQAHSDCQPYFFAVELDERMLSCELLVRTRQRVKCDCIQYADGEQRNWIISLIDAILEKLDIKT